MKCLSTTRHEKLLSRNALSVASRVDIPPRLHEMLLVFYCSVGSVKHQFVKKNHFYEKEGYLLDFDENKGHLMKTRNCPQNEGRSAINTMLSRLIRPIDKMARSDSVMMCVTYQSVDRDTSEMTVAPVNVIHLLMSPVSEETHDTFCPMMRVLSGDACRCTRHWLDCVYDENQN